MGRGWRCLRPHVRCCSDRESKTARTLRVAVGLSRGLYLAPRSARAQNDDRYRERVLTAAEFSGVEQWFERPNMALALLRSPAAGRVRGRAGVPSCGAAEYGGNYPARLITTRERVAQGRTEFRAFVENAVSFRSFGRVARIPGVPGKERLSAWAAEVEGGAIQEQDFGSYLRLWRLVCPPPHLVEVGPARGRRVCGGVCGLAGGNGWEVAIAPVQASAASVGSMAPGGVGVRAPGCFFRRG